MPDYKISTIKLPSQTAGGHLEEIHFANLPFGGKMHRRGPEGLIDILDAIQRQYTERSIEIDLDELKRWLRVLTERNAEFERVEVLVKDAVPDRALVSDLYSGEMQEIDSPEQLTAFIYSGPGF